MTPDPTEPLSPWRAWLERLEARDMAPVVSLLVLVAFFTVTARGFFGPATVVQILKQGSVLAIVSVGMTYALLCAEIDLAVGFLALWTACLCGWLFRQPFFVPPGAEDGAAAWAVALTVILPLLSTLALGLLSGLLTVLSRLPSFIITIAMMNISYGMSLYLTKSERFAVPPLLRVIGNRGVELPGGYELPYSAMVAAAVMLVGHLILQHTRFGRYVYMTGGNREATRLSGVRTGLVVVGCLAVSAVCAGLGGLLNAGRLEGVTLDQNADLLLAAVACVVLGGTSLFGGEGGVGRTLIGVLTFTVLKVGLNKIEWIDPQARTLLMGVVLMSALVINGVLGRKRE